MGREEEKKKQFSTIQQQLAVNIQYSLKLYESPDSRMIIATLNYSACLLFAGFHCIYAKFVCVRFYSSLIIPFNSYTMKAELFDTAVIEVI